MTVEQLKMKRKEKKGQLNSYIKRINSIKSIISNIDSRFDDYVGDMNQQISNCINELTAGLKGCGVTKTIGTNMEDCKQKYSESDSKISSSRSNLSSEVSRCQEKINSLESEIRSLENQIKRQG